MNAVRRGVYVAGIAIASVIVTWSAASVVTGVSLCLVVSEDSQVVAPHVHTKGEIAAPLRGLNFDDGDWAAYIVLDYYDYRELRGELRRNCLKLADREGLKRLQRELVGKYTGADVATVTSRLIFRRNGKVVYSSGIVLSGRNLLGLETREWGWLQPEDPRVSLRFADRFRPVYGPIVVL